MFDLFKRLLGNPVAKPTPAAPRSRLKRDMPEALFAIGDVHGRLDLLRDMERKIADAASAVRGPKLIVMLGDYVDRGPASASVLDHLLSEPPAGFERVCLLGNHEQMMIDFLEHPDLDAGWLSLGGIETLASYGIPIDRIGRMRRKQLQDTLLAHIPSEHLEFTKKLPVCLEMPEYFFSHGGPLPNVEIDLQNDRDLIWNRPANDEYYERFAKTVVHGHTPLAEPLVRGKRVCLNVENQRALAALGILPNTDITILTVFA